MEFAGREYIYISKLKKDKIKNLQQAEKENEEDAPVIKEEEEEEEKKEKKEDKKECELSIDLLNERIKALQKYYEAYIKSYGKIKDSKERKIKLYEEKIKKYREYLAIYEEISGEIKK